MPRATVVSEVPLRRSPRVLQVEGLFDVPPAEQSRQLWQVNLPLDERAWHVGLIVGSSGAGKSTVARALFPEALLGAQPWPEDAAVLDAFPAEMSVRTVIDWLTAVGFASPPSWLRPYRCLSTGEQFRVSMARALAESPGLVVVDEFTSTVDRQVAQVASHAVQKATRRAGQQLIAVTCHYDVLDWLQPDWVYEPEGDRFTWRSLQRRPALQLSVHTVDRTAWAGFRRHHYLSSDLASSAVCFGGFIDGLCVAFTSYRHFPHPRTRDIMIGHRLVVSPDYQGLGIGGQLDDWLGQHLYDRGYRYRNVVSHPAMIRTYSASPRWRACGGVARQLSTATHEATIRRAQLNPRQLQTRSFEYVPPAVPA